MTIRAKAKKALALLNFWLSLRLLVYWPPLALLVTKVTLITPKNL